MKAPGKILLHIMFFVSAAFALPARAAAEDWESVVWSASEGRAESFAALCLERGLTSADVLWANDYAPQAAPDEGAVILVPKSKSALLPTWLEVQSRKSGGPEPMVTVKLHSPAPPPESEPMVTVPLHGSYENMRIIISGDSVVVGTQPGTPPSSKTSKTPETPAAGSLKRPGPAKAPGKMMWPVDGKVSSGFGRRGRRRMHHGIDIPMPKGTPVAAAQDGVVADIGSNRGRYRGYGNVVLIDHGGGIVTMYSHCASVSVKKGQSVRMGDIVGTVGNTGRTTTHHVHFEIRKDGKPVDPLPYLPAR